MLTKNTAQYLRLAILQAVKEIREAYNAQNVAHLNFTISVSGRTAGDLKLEFSFSDSMYSSKTISSHDPVAALEEILRRYGWEKDNTGLLLSYSGDEAVAEPPASDDF